jgi:hypothetical protein
MRIASRSGLPRLLGALLMCALLAAGCQALGAEDKITPQEIAAADGVTVTFRNLKPQLMPQVTRKYIRDNRLFIVGEVLNSSPGDVDDVRFHAFAFDELERLIEPDLPLIYPMPRSLPPGVAGRFSVDLDATGVTVVVIEEAD